MGCRWDALQDAAPTQCRGSAISGGKTESPRQERGDPGEATQLTEREGQLFRQS